MVMVTRNQAIFRIPEKPRWPQLTAQMAGDNEDKLYGALLTLNAATVRAVLDSSSPIRLRPKFAGSVLHDLLQETTPDEFASCRHRRAIAHMLTFAGLDVNAVDEVGNSALHILVSRFGGDAEMVEPLIQAGANIYLTNSSGKNVLDLVATSHSVPSEVVDLFEKYSPGLWRAVVSDDLLSVRKLINLWCRVDISRDGKTLREKALDMGTEHIIRLIKEIEPSMKLAHAVLAEAYIAAEEILTSNKETPNLEFKNLGDMGATPLFYSILQNDARLVRLLSQHGARSDAMITLQDEEIPILFAALHKDADPEIIKYLIPPRKDSPLSLSTLHYQGRHVLLHCIKNDTGAAVVRHILNMDYCELVYLRNQHNMCTRDMAVFANKADYVATIDEAVYDWYLDVNDENRKAMALMGYTHLREAAKDGVRACEVVQSMETSSPQAQFDTQLHSYQDQIERLVNAVVTGNLDQVWSLISFVSDSPTCFTPCLANCRAKGESQPLIHKAVLHGHTAVVDFLAQTITGTLQLKLDDVRDKCMRTALHYAYALPHSKHLVGLLLDYGASEFTMDKDFRSPLVFKDFRGQPDMDKLLAWHRGVQTDFTPEPDPWSKRLPPIIQAIKAQGCSSAEFIMQQGAPCGLQPPQQPVYSWISYCTIL